MSSSVPVLVAALTVDWGTIPDWLAGAGTLLAFAVTIRLLLVELGRERQRRSEDDQAQASKVAAWVFEVSRGAPDELQQWPVHHHEPFGSSGVRVVVQVGDEHPNVGVERFPVLRPSLDDTFYVRMPRHVEPTVERAERSFPVLSLTFTDAAGRL